MASIELEDTLELSEGMGEVPQDPAPLEKEDSTMYYVEILPSAPIPPKQFSSMKPAEIPATQLSQMNPAEIPSTQLSPMKTAEVPIGSLSFVAPVDPTTTPTTDEPIPDTAPLSLTMLPHSLLE